MATATMLTFPHPILTVITGTPTNSSLQLLKKQLFANARAIPSTRGGGANGHLALIMTAAVYLARTNIAFDLPVHPGPAPAHAQGATAPQITETNRQYTADLQEYRLYLTVQEELKKHLLAAVPPMYLRTLEDPDLGFADVTSITMLTHLQDTYGQISREEIDANRNKLTADWNADDPIEDLWSRNVEVQRLASVANEAIPDTAVIRLTLSVFERTGVFTTACEKWRDKPDVDWTTANFQTHFNLANKERIRQLTARQAGYHGANSAIVPVITPPPAIDHIAAAITNTITSSNTKMYYCWTHGLGLNANHDSTTCQRKADGHIDAATILDMKGGNDRIMTRANRAQRRLPQQD
jgi:hypothetical protein